MVVGSVLTKPFFLQTSAKSNFLGKGMVWICSYYMAITYILYILYMYNILYIYTQLHVYYIYMENNGSGVNV